MNIQELTNNFIERWDKSSGNFAFGGNTIPVAEKMQHEKKMLELSKNLNKEADLNSLDSTGQKLLIEELKGTMGVMLQHIFDFSNKEIAIISKKGFMGVTKEFMKMAKAFDPEVSIEDIFQASRNLWIINSLQIMMEKPVELSSSIFAYSMLYPYSDNYLDNPNIAAHDKLIFSRQFRKRLRGEPVIPHNKHEDTIFDLVALIEKDWDRESFPEVYESLLAIHDAQTKSISLLSTEMSNADLLEICIEKGGTSVLADAYLISGKLSKEQEIFSYGFGTYLQFIDDIQDLQEDIDGGLNTLFTRAARTGKLERYINKTLFFGRSVLGDLSAFSLVDKTSMQGLMTKSISFLLIEAIGLNKEYLLPEYTNKTEEYAAFRFDFIRKRRNKMNSNRLSMMKKMEQFLFYNENKSILA